jgi:hypothetical protein
MHEDRLFTVGDSSGTIPVDCLTPYFGSRTKPDAWLDTKA